MFVFHISRKIKLTILSWLLIEGIEEYRKYLMIVSVILEKGYTRKRLHKIKAIFNKATCEKGYLKIWLLSKKGYIDYLKLFYVYVY